MEQLKINVEYNDDIEWERWLKKIKEAPDRGGGNILDYEENGYALIACIATEMEASEALSIMGIEHKSIPNNYIDKEY